MDSGVLSFLGELCDRNIHFAVTSARRTPAQNKACNGVSNSQHLIGCAIDLKPLPPFRTSDLVDVLLPMEYDQLIIYPTFIHVSFVCDIPNAKVRKQLIRK